MKHGGGVFRNRECANCAPPCTGGEVLHRRGHCCHDWCPCMEFEPAQGKSLTNALDGRVKSKRRFLDQGRVEG